MKRLWVLAGLVLGLALLAGCSTVNDAGNGAGLRLQSVETTPGYLGNPVGGTQVTSGLNAADVMPSTNQKNFDSTDYAYVELVSADIGQVTLKFVSRHSYASCFEYRIDDEAPTSTSNGGANYNPDVADGMWNFTCLTGGSIATPAETTKTVAASDHVDIRMVFGAETNERFDWTRFYPLTLDSMDQCKNGAWEGYGFKNQGQCIASIVANPNSGH